MEKRATRLKDAGWRYATARTVRQLRDIFEQINPGLSESQRHAYLAHAAVIVDSMRGSLDAGRYWGVYTNTLRILVAAAAESAPDKLFTDEDTDSDE